MSRAVLLNPFLHPDVVVQLDDAELTPDVVSVSRTYDIRGGAGAYTAGALRQCGWDVMPVDRVGSDMFGDFTVQNLIDLGCDVSHVDRYEGPHMFVTSIADRSSLGATMLSCCPPEWWQSAESIADGVHAVPPAEVVYLWSWFWSYANPHVSDVDLPDVMEACREKADLLAVDPSWKPAGAPPPGEVAALRQHLGHVDILKLNVRDAATLVGEMDPRQSVTALLALGPRVVVLTTGASGCLVGGVGNSSIWRVPTAGLPSRDTTGAGDTFGGRFVARFSETGDALLAAGEASAVASLLVSGSSPNSITDLEVARLSERIRHESEAV